MNFRSFSEKSSETRKSSYRRGPWNQSMNKLKRTEGFCLVIQGFHQLKNLVEIFHLEEFNKKLWKFGGSIERILNPRMASFQKRKDGGFFLDLRKSNCEFIPYKKNLIYYFWPLIRWRLYALKFHILIFEGENISKANFILKFTRIEPQKARSVY